MTIAEYGEGEDEDKDPYPPCDVPGMWIPAKRQEHLSLLKYPKLALTEHCINSFEVGEAVLCYYWINGSVS